jgi:DNA polymerase III psi subunit
VWDDENSNFHQLTRVPLVKLETRRVDCDDLEKAVRWLYASEQQLIVEVLLLFGIAKSLDVAKEMFRQLNIERQNRLA